MQQIQVGTNSYSGASSCGSTRDDRILTPGLALPLPGELVLHFHPRLRHSLLDNGDALQAFKGSTAIAECHDHCFLSHCVFDRMLVTDEGSSTLQLVDPELSVDPGIRGEFIAGLRIARDIPNVASRHLKGAFGLLLEVRRLSLDFGSLSSHRPGAHEARRQSDLGHTCLYGSTMRRFLWRISESVPVHRRSVGRLLHWRL